MSRSYCIYCGHIAHRCQCADEESQLKKFLSQRPIEFSPLRMSSPYKRGVPPQIKHRERTTLRRNYAAWYGQLVEHYSEKCLHCGKLGDDTQLVIDHILPIAKGGLSEFANLQLLCAECNRLKGKLFFDCR